MMTDMLILAWALATGVVLGGVFFGGLWWTVRKGTTCRHPALLFMCSFLLRTSIVLAGFYFVAGGHWRRLFACLLGFILARLIVTKLTGKPIGPCSTPAKEIRHAT